MQICDVKSICVAYRLRVVSNFGDCDCGAGKIHTRALESSRRRLLEISRARVCILPAPQSASPKLETTRSLCSLPVGVGVFLRRENPEFAILAAISENTRRGGTGPD